MEFEASFFNATFADPNNTFEAIDVSVDTLLSEGFVQPQVEGIFFDEFDNLFSEAETLTGGEIELTRDNEEGQSDRTAGSIDAFELVPRPISISGTVFGDDNLNWVQDADESGIEGVTIELQQLNEETGYTKLLRPRKPMPTATMNSAKTLGLDQEPSNWLRRSPKVSPTSAPRQVRPVVPKAST